MIAAMGDVMREAYKRNWITARDGNCSLRLAKERVLYITPSGVMKNTILPESILRIPIFRGKLAAIDGASGELEMHWLLQRKHRETRCVLHLHPTYTVAAMMAGWDLRDLSEGFPEVYRYTRVGNNVGKWQATSPMLAEDTLYKMQKNEVIHYNIVGQTAHGVCAIGPDPWAAFEHIERLEHICKITMASGLRPE
jgi:ribulose-5-phosphate 4-epimerase/fuculose-1-phosphate aldolase